MPHAPIARPRLVARLTPARVGIVEAGGGYGKSTLAEAVAADAGVATVTVDLAGVGPGVASVLGALRRAVRTAGLAAFAEALVLEGTDDSALPDAVGTAVRDELVARAEPLLLVIDEVHAASADGVGLLAGVVRSVPAPHRVLLVGRTIPAAIVDAAPDAVRLGADDLALTVDEVAAMAHIAGRSLDSVDAASLRARTGGWPAAVVLELERPAGPRTDGEGGIDASLRSLLAAAGEKVAQVAAAVAALPRIDARTAEAVAGTGALERLLAAGLPFRRRADGWLELPDPLRDRLRSATAPVPEAIRTVAAAYLDAGEPGVAVAWLVASGDPEALAVTLAGRPWHELTSLDAGELRAVLATLPPDVVDRHPRVLLAAARAAESSVHIAWRGELLGRAREATATRTDPVLEREVVSELAADASRSGDVDAAVTLASDVLRSAGPGEGRTRAVALTALGRAKAFSRDPVAMVEAVELLSEAAALLRQLGEPDLLRGDLQTMGYGIHFARGDLDAAIDALREAADLAPAAIRTRAGVQTFLADALVYAGALDEAEAILRDVLGVARRLRDHRLLGYHAWMQAGIASRRGDGAAVEAWLAEAERHPADWFAHPTGIEFLADAVDHLGRVGEHAAAARYLARVEARCAMDGHEGIDQIALVARAIHGARAGDPVAAEHDLVACLSLEQVAPREHWRMYLLRALAALRTGDEAAARKLGRRAFEAAAAMGHPALPRVHEADATARLTALLDQDAAPGAPEPLIGAPRLHVRLMGVFAVTVDGRAADPPDGKPSQLLKLLAVVDRQVPVDEAVEALWPDVDPDVGRRRVRNVLARIRSTCGDLVVRDEESLRLDPAVEVDAVRFEAEAKAALAASADRQEGLARVALGRFAGELLPGDRYEDFTTVARERVAMRHVALLDRLAALTAVRGDIDEALRLMEEAIGAEPLDERRYQAAIGVAMRHGRRDRAIRLLERARLMEAELSDEPSPELASLARELGMDGPAAGRR